MKMPILDSRNKKDLYAEVLEKAKEFVPEWNTSSETEDAGLILSRVFAGMFEGVLARYNKMPYQNFLYFLNILGADTLPAKAAKGYVSVKMNPGDYSGVFIKKGTRLYRQKEGGKRILYELKEDIFAIDNTLEAIFCQNQDESILVCPFEKGMESPFSLFDFYNGKNLQKYRITFAEERIFQLEKGAVLIVSFLHKEKPYLEEQMAEFLSGADVKWYYLTEEGWVLIENTECMGNTIQLYLEEEIPLTSYEEKQSRWISCEILQRKEKSELSFTEISVSSKANFMEPENLYGKGIALLKTDFMPFGERFGLYDDFYINCEKVFSKKKAFVTIDMEIYYRKTPLQERKEKKKMHWKPILPESAIKEPDPVPIFAQQVVWEYWNGTGWAGLFSDHRFSAVFAGKENSFCQITFVCPEDLEPTVIGANQGRWIRARILSVNSLFELDTYFHTPVIRKIAISFTYKKQCYPVEYFYTESNLEVQSRNQKEEICLFDSSGSAQTAAYFAFRKPLKGGPFRFYFRNEGKMPKEMPAIRWECFVEKNGKHVWKELRVMDETEFFSKSGLITFLCHFRMQKEKRFGKECFWIRAVRIKDESGQKLPCFNRIDLNTVKIEQQESMEPEYFYMEAEQAHKICELVEKNITSIRVYVNESAFLLGEEKNNSDSELKKDSIIERNEQGSILEYWVLWEETAHFEDCDSESRVFRVDRKKGRVLFGDGKQGKIPVSGEEPTIRIDYCIADGEDGNCGLNEIADFADSVPFVQSVSNLEWIGGGCDMETIAEAIQRCKKRIKVQDRAVSAEDYEMLVKQADRNIVRVKVFSNATEEGRQKAGTLQIVVLPRYERGSELYFSEIKKNIDCELRQKAPATLVLNQNLSIEEVKYIRFHLTIEAVVQNYHDYLEAYHSMEQKLKQYFHPISGNYHGLGFEIGEIPTKTKIYHYIKTAEKITRIENIYIRCYEPDQKEGKEIDYFAALRYATGVPVNGTHEINLTVMQ